MAAAAELFGNFGDINIAFRTQTGAIDTRRGLFEERRGFDFAHCQRIVHKSVGIFFGRFEKLEIAGALMSRGIFALEDDPVRAIRDEKGLTQVSDAGALEAAVDRILAANPKEAESYRGGKVGLLSFFVGQIMKETRGKANPKVVQEVLRKKLGQGG